MYDTCFSVTYFEEKIDTSTGSLTGTYTAPNKKSKFFPSYPVPPLKIERKGNFIHQSGVMVFKLPFPPQEFFIRKEVLDKEKRKIDYVEEKPAKIPLKEIELQGKCFLVQESLLTTFPSLKEELLKHVLFKNL